MGKINKFANIYDKDGNLLRHVNKDGVLENYTIKELEDLVDKLSKDKDENGNIKDQQSLNNVIGILFQQYQKLRNPHEKIFSRFTQNVTESAESTEEQVEQKLNEVMAELAENEEDTANKPTEYEMDKYIDFEIVNEDGNKQ